MQKQVHLVDLVKSFPTNIFLHNLASIQKRTSPIKFAHLAEKSENLSTKVRAAGREALREAELRAERVDPRRDEALELGVEQLLHLTNGALFHTVLVFGPFQGLFSAVSTPIFENKYPCCSIFFEIYKRMSI